MTSLRHRLWLGFGGLLLILLLVSVLSVFFLTRYSHAIEQLFHDNYDSAVYCDAMKDSLNRLNLRTQWLAWDVGGADPIDPVAEEQRFEKNLDAQLQNCTLPGEREATNELRQLWEKYNRDRTTFEGAPASTRQSLHAVDLLRQYQKMNEVAQRIADENMANMASVDQRVMRTLLDVRDALLILAIVGAAAAAIVVGAAGASILQPLRLLTRSARQIERGDLQLTLPVRANDEIGMLAVAFNSMAAKLREFRKLDHERLIRTQQTTQLAIDSLPDAVFIIGSDGQVEISNRTARDHFGIEPGSWVSQLGEKLRWLPPLYQSVFEGDQSPKLPGYELPSYTSALQLFDQGNERFLLPRAVPMMSPANMPIGVAVILVDVTRLRQADEAKSGLVSTVSHELRTPLTSIRMSLSLLVGDKFGPLTARQAMLFKAAHEDSDRLYRIIENLLSISRIESGRATFQFCPMMPRDIILQAVESSQSTFAEKRIELLIDAPADLPRVRADPVVIASALTNLLSNALKFTPAGGTVRIVAFVDDRGVAFEVSDTGCGIPEQYVPRLFDRFFRVPRKDGPTGVGLGLAIAKEIVEAHGGQIQLCPGNGVGSTFRFTLPRSEAISRNS